MPGRRLVGIVIAAGALALAAAGVRWALDRSFAREVAEARRELDGGLFAAARQRLVRLDAARPGRGDVGLLLGRTEQGRGKLDAAIAAWSRVPADSALAGEAGVLRARAALRAGRLLQAEEALLATLNLAGDHRPEAARQWVQLLRIEGRIDEIRPLLERQWAEGAEPVGILRELWGVEHDPYPVDSVRAFLEESRAQVPDDPRTELALGRLALRLGRFAEARGRIDAALKRRPDAAGWRARLDLARAEDRVDDARAALEHLRSAPLDAARVLEIRAWLRSRSGPPGREAAALRDLLRVRPGDTPALGRLAELASRAGRNAEAAELRRRKAELDRVRDAYVAALGRDNPGRDAAELARLAGRMGLAFEAHAWRSLAGLPSSPPEAAPEGPTVADLLAEWELPRPAAPIARVEPAATALEFIDEAEAAGLRFVQENGQSPQRHLPETMAGGLALIDYDGDGRLDVYCVQGGPFPPDKSGNAGGDRLFRSLGGGRFEDVTARAGIAPDGYGHGVAVGDVDGDGHSDLFLTRWRRYILLRNRGDGTFEDVTSAWGLAGDRDWPTSAAFADLDGDGDLDLYVCHYLRWDPEHPYPCRDEAKGVSYYCNPRLLPALPDHLFRNDGGRFTDVTEAAGIVDTDGRGLGVVAADLDGDRRIDLYVANDTTANFFFRNLGGMRFRETAHEAGIAAGADGGYQAGMGIACGDADGDGTPDLAVTNFFGEGASLYQNLGRGLFSERAAACGLTAATRHRLGFGIAWLDADADGRLDLAIANGHVNDGRPKFPFAMPAQLLRGVGGGRLEDVSERAGEAWLVPRLGRALVAGDLDDDGRPDVLIQGLNAPLAWLRNRSAGAGRAITLRLEGTASGRDAIGAVVTLRAGGRTRTARRTGGGSYQSAGDPRIHFGLGDLDRIDGVEVHWPSGRVDRPTGLKSGAIYNLREGAAGPIAVTPYARTP